MDQVEITRVESESIRDFALVMQQDDRIQPRAPHNGTPAGPAWIWTRTV